MQTITLFFSLLALTASGLASAHAMDYRTQDRVYLDNELRGNGNYRDHNRGGYADIGGRSHTSYHYGTRPGHYLHQNLNNKRHEHQRLAPIYVRKPINFAQSASDIQRQRMSFTNGKRVEGRQSDNALHARLINMNSKKQSRNIAMPQNRVALPQVGITQQPQQPYKAPSETAKRATLHQLTPTLSNSRNMGQINPFKRDIAINSQAF